MVRLIPEKTEVANVFRCRKCKNKTGGFHSIHAHERKKECKVPNYSDFTSNFIIIL